MFLDSSAVLRRTLRRVGGVALVLASEIAMLLLLLIV